MSKENIIIKKNKILSMILFFCIIFTTLPSYAVQEKANISENQSKIGSDDENDIATVFSFIAGISIFTGILPMIFGTTIGRSKNYIKGLVGLQLELNTVKANINNNIDKSTGVLVGINLQTNFKQESNTENEYFLITEITPSFLFKKGLIISTIGDAGLGLKKENLYGFLDTSFILGVSIGSNKKKETLDSVTQEQPEQVKSGPPLNIYSGGFYARGEIGVKPFKFMGNESVNLIFSLGYRFFTSKDNIAINSFNSSIKLGF